MKFSVAAVAALAAGVSAGSNVTYTTEVVTALTTYCPEATKITHGGKTYTVTEATTLTITDCPCTVTKPVITTPVVVCNTCGYNTTVPTTPVPTKPLPTGGNKPSSPPSVPTAGAAKAAGLSGAGLAAALGLAALL
ncbi:uncharacterized protein E0L32_011675 [Thyridium curvatum]|uniref:Clock-controlled protein 6 n=1 Tax=Thyridium curvatum TaxID=1093900 RepID=A0A507BI51_9PEZI|nr:uncharacterized protein E0L32_011675 [Thyridium curvatum]TPX18434.1 hypothetical protein E0L32_011675 [Thyridium curvatum]